MRVFCWLLGHLWAHACQCARCGKMRGDQHHLEGCQCTQCGEIIHHWSISRWSYDGDTYTFEKECVKCKEKTRSREHVPFDKLVLGKELTIS